MSVSVHPIWPWPLVTLLAGGLLAFSWWTYANASAPRRAALIGLRLLAIGVVCFVLFRPSLVFTIHNEQNATVAIVVDHSRSMNLRDELDLQSRCDAMRRQLAKARPAMDRLAEHASVRWFSFARDVAEATPSAEPPDGDQTAIGDALADVLKRTASDRLAAAILLSDGANTTGRPPLTVGRELAAQKVPVFSFGFGQETSTDEVRDVAARSIGANETVFAKNKLTVRGEFSGRGFANVPINVRLLLDGEEKARGVMNMRGEGDKGFIDLSAVPEKTGDVKVTLVADAQNGELLPGNNAVSTFVTVLGGGVGVLQIEGKYRFWEPKYLRWALDQSPQIELSQLFLLDSAGKESAITDDLFKPGRFDVIILGDVSAKRLSRPQLDRLNALLEKGAGLLMMGGYESFGPGGWGETQIADHLPIVIRANDGQFAQPRKLTPTPQGLRHYLLRLASLDGDANAKAWQSLRPLDGGNRWAGLKPNAQVLAVAEDGAPLLVAQEGASRVIAFAGDTTWRWRKGREGILAHARFWRQVILWLAHKEDEAGAQVRLKLARRRVPIGRALEFRASVENANGPAPTLQAIVEGPAGSAPVPVPLIASADGAVGTFRQTDRTGDYVVRVVATSNGQVIGSASTKFLVFAEDAEFRQLASDLEALKNLSRVTQGEYHPGQDFASFMEEFANRKLTTPLDQQSLEPLWDRWELLALFIATLAAEWTLRKKSGLA